jgi:hypothetical protein
MESENKTTPAPEEGTGIVHTIVHMAESVVEGAKDKIHHVAEMAEHLKENVQFFATSKMLTSIF